MIFNDNYETDGDLIVVLPGIKGEPQYTCLIMACSNPACDCGEISLELTPLPENNDMKTRNIELNIKSRALKPSEMDNAFAMFFHSQMTEEDWQLLNSFYLAYKGGLACNEPVENIRYNFDDYAVKNGTLVAYGDVLPFDNYLWITLDEIDYAVIDSYCLNPSCNCKDALISVGRIPAGDRKRIEVKLDYAFHIGYLSRQWLEKKTAGIIPMAVFKAAFETRHPDFYAMLKERHEKLRQIYARSRSDDVPETPQLLPRTGKIGRNEPCPCGSGKKYKRCCGK